MPKTRIIYYIYCLYNTIRPVSIARPPWGGEHHRPYRIPTFALARTSAASRGAERQYC